MSYSDVKRVIDFGGALLGLILLGPLIAVISLLVLVFHGAPVIFSQERVTKGERIFTLRKFRSMRPVDPQRGWVTDEDRLTSLGRLLRSTSLDELPSLVNVLSGDMSLIGPRPLTTDYLPLYTPEQARRHDVRGGLSGLTQVSGRNSLTWDEKFDLDLQYVETMSFTRDLRILVKTLTAVASRRGVNSGNEATAESYGGSLRSDRVVFHPSISAREISSWTVDTTDGQRIGRCMMLKTGDRSRMIRFYQEPAGDIAAREDYQALCGEVLRLLLNRVRSSDADFAVCSMSSVSFTAAQIYSRVGFRPLTTDLIPTVLPLAELITDQAMFLYRFLHAENEQLTEMGIAS